MEWVVVTGMVTGDCDSTPPFRKVQPSEKHNPPREGGDLGVVAGDRQMKREIWAGQESSRTALTTKGIKEVLASQGAIMMKVAQHWTVLRGQSRQLTVLKGWGQHWSVLCTFN